MEGSARDDTQDWLLPEGARPPLLSELEARIDEALIVAKASEKAVMAVGDAALDAAEQARRAADLAERATAAVFDGLAAGGNAGGGAAGGNAGGGAAGGAEGAPIEAEVALGAAAAGARAGTDPAAGSGRLRFAPEDAALRSFSERADRVVARLEALERLSLPQQG